MACHGLSALVGCYGPVLNSTIGMKDEMLVCRARIADCSFSPMTNRRVRIFRRRIASRLKCDDRRVSGLRGKGSESKSGTLREPGNLSEKIACSHLDLGARQSDKAMRGYQAYSAALLRESRPNEC